MHPIPNLDGPVKSQKSSVFVIPANAGIQDYQAFMDPRFRGGDGLGDFLRIHQILKVIQGFVDRRASWFSLLLPAFA